MTIPFGHWAGLQLVRRYDTVGHVGPGSCSSAGALPAEAPQLYIDKGWKWRGEEGAALITVPGGTRLDFDLAEDCYDDNGEFRYGVGAVLNGRKADGGLEDGFYSVFVYGYGRPDADGKIPASQTGVYISNYAIGYGFGSDGTRGGNGDLKKPSALRYLRQHPAVLQIQDGKMIPYIAEGEGHTITCRYNLPEYRPYKSARVGGIFYDEDGVKGYNHTTAVVPTEPQEGDLALATLVDSGASERDVLRRRVGLELDLDTEGLSDRFTADDVKEIEYGLFHVCPQTHKIVEMQVEYEGSGYIYDSVSRSIGRKTAIVNGESVTRFKSTTGSDASGRGIKLTLLGDVRITRFFLMASTSQQPT